MKRPFPIYVMECFISDANPSLLRPWRKPLNCEAVVVQTKTFTSIYPFGNDLTFQSYLSFQCKELPLIKSEGYHSYEWSKNLGFSLVTERTGKILGHCTSRWENLGVSRKWPWVVGKLKGKTSSAQKGSPRYMKWIWHCQEKRLVSVSLWFIGLLGKEGQQKTVRASLEEAKYYIKFSLEILSGFSITINILFFSSQYDFLKQLDKACWKTWWLPYVHLHSVNASHQYYEHWEP